MIKNTVIDRCLKSDFKAFEQIGEKEYILRWGMTNETERVYSLNEETGEPEFTGEIRETDWCTYETGIYEGNLSPYWLDKALEGRTRHASVKEYKAIYDGIGVSEKQQLPLLKEKLKAEINRYDKSDAVEDFSIGGVHIWLNSELRTKVRENLETAQRNGEETVVLRYGGLEFPMSVEMGWQLYYAVLDYARACWNATQIHLANVDKITVLTEVLDYDYTTGYPAKLAF